MQPNGGRPGRPGALFGGDSMNTDTMRMLLRPAKGETGVVALPVAAFSIVTTLVLTVVGGAQSFWKWTDDLAPVYQALAAIALVLLVVPLASLGGSAARLSARRRDERLSTLRLLGVTTAGVATLTVAESVLLAAAGAATGVVAHIALSPLIGLIPFRGEALGFSAAVLPPLGILLVVVSILLLAATSAVVGLRRVSISPLGVRMRTTATTVHWVRAVIAVGVLGIAFAVTSVFPSAGGFVAIVVVLAGMFAGVLAVLHLVGPWVVKVVSTRQLRRAEKPERLLAARLVLDSPKAAWRQVGGVAMASFMAVFAGTGVALMDVMGNADVSADDLELVADMRTGLIVTLVVSFLMVAASVTINQASEALDQNDLHRSLHHLGVPLGTVDRARRRAVMSPLLATAIGSAVCAAILVFPLVGLALITAPLSILTIAAVILVGIGLVWVSTRVVRPILAQSFRAA